MAHFKVRPSEADSMSLLLLARLVLQHCHWHCAPFVPSVRSTVGQLHELRSLAECRQKSKALLAWNQKVPPSIPPPSQKRAQTRLD